MVDPLIDEVCIYYNGYSRARVIQLVTINTAYGYGWYEKAVGNVTWRSESEGARGRWAVSQRKNWILIVNEAIPRNYLVEVTK